MKDATCDRTTSFISQQDRKSAEVNLAMKNNAAFQVCDVKCACGLSLDRSIC